jgi:hypothetical protein
LKYYISFLGFIISSLVFDIPQLMVNDLVVQFVRMDAMRVVEMDKD